MKIVQTFQIDEAGVQVNDAAGAPVMVDFTINDAVENLIRQGALLNDDEGVFFQRQLELIQAQSYDVEYPELMGRTIFGTNTEGGEGIETITYRSYDKRGETAIIAGKATDLPRGDINGDEYSISIKTLGNAFGYSRQELASAKVTGMALEARKAEATRKSYEEKVNQLVFFGSAENKIHGLFGGPADAPWSTVTSTVIADGAGGTTAWYGPNASKTPDEIIKDLTDACSQMYVQTKKIYRPNEILISVQAKQFLMNTPRTETSDVSIMNWFLANNMFIKSADQFKDINELEGIYPATANTAAFDPTGQSFDGFTVRATGDDNARLREPFPYTHLPVQLKGLEMEINCYGRFGGVEMIRPASIQHFMGVTVAE